MTEGAKSRGGRPWSFDRDAAVDTAMRLFWRHGYEGVSIGDLTAAIGIAAPSLYSAFGNKAGLYREAITRYEETFGFPSQINAAMSLPEAVRLLLDGAIQAVTHPDRERGCMISSGMVACHPDHAALARDMAERREEMRGRIALALGRFDEPDRVRRLARYLAAVMQGISIQARDGAGRAQLNEVADEVVAGVVAMDAQRS